MSVIGKALVRKDGEETKNSVTLIPGDSVYEGDVINTPSNGAVKLLLQDKTLVDLGPSSLFKVNKFVPNQGENREVELGMMYGTVRTAVTKKLQGKGKFNIRTPSATIGRTEFVVPERGWPAVRAPSPRTGSSRAEPRRR